MHTEPAEKNFLDMSDDEISGMSAPPVPAADVEVIETTTDDDTNTEQKIQEQLDAEKAADDAANAEEAETQRLAAEAEAAEQAAAAQAEADRKKADEAANPLSAADDKILAAPDPKAKKPEEKPAADDKTKKPDDKTGTVEKTDAEKLAEAEAADKAAKEKQKVAAPLTMEQKAAALDGLMTFKANGKEIKLNSVDELQKLAQMGANYTKKMQQLQPVMRLFKMLENNQLTDPNQLSYLIDLHQKKPEAIQKLLADSKFDPHTVDAEKAATYKPENHQVTDIEVEFAEVVKEVEASPTGKELLFEVSKQWDLESRQALFRQPSLLAELNSQKALGFYGKITTEMERQRMLGKLQGVPFLAAYEEIGKELYAKGELWPVDEKVPAKEEVKQTPAEPQKREPTEVRTATPAKQVSNSDKAKAASAPKANAATTPKEPSYLDMPDDKFLSEFQGRL